MKTALMRDVGIEDEFVYDGDLCFEIYLKYLDGITTESHLITYLKRYVVLQVRSDYLYLGVDICEDLVQSAITELWMSAVGQHLPTKNAATFHAFCNTIMHRQISKCFKTVYDDAPRKIPQEFYTSRYYIRDPSAKDIDDALFLDDLPGILAKRVLGSMRFSDEHTRAAALYMVERIMAGERIVEPLLRRHYKIKSIGFLVEHVLVRIKMELYYLRRYVDFTSTADKRLILQSGIEEQQ